MAQKAKSVVDTILGEAVPGDFNDMVSIASTIANRAVSTGVTQQDIVSAPGQFDAYGKALPPGVDNFRDLAKQAIDHIRDFGPVHPGTFYATPAATKNLPSGLTPVAQTKGHQYFADPKNRAIRTAKGYVRPDPAALQAARASLPDVGPMPESRPASVDFSPETIAESLNENARAPGLAGLSPSFNAGMQGTIADFDRTGLSPSADAMASELDAMGFGSLGVNSGYRDPSRNARVGGARKSQHVRGNALDLATKGLPDFDKSRVLDAALSAGAKGVGAYPSGTIHVDTRAQPGFWGPNPKNPYAGVSISQMPGWAQADLQALVDANGANYLPSGINNNVPTPVSRPDLSALAAPGAFSQASFNAMTPDIGMPSERAALAGLIGVDASAAMPGRSRVTPTAPPQAAMPGRSRVTPSAPPQAAKNSSIVSPPESMPGRSRVAPTVAPTRNAIVSAPAPAPAPAPSPTFDQSAFNAMTPAISMPSAQPSFAPAAPVNTVDDANLAADKVARENQILDNLAVAAAAQAPARQVAPAVAPTFAAPARQAAPQRAAPARAAPPAPPSFSGQDVWSGKATSGIATNGNQMSRNPDGSVSMTSSKYGYTETMNPDGSFRSTTAPGVLGIDNALSGLFNGVQAKTPSVSQSVIDQSVSPPSANPGLRGLANKGALKGGMIGASLAGIPGGVLGALLGGLISRERAQRQNPRNVFNAGFQPGLGFPDQPDGARSQGGLTAFGEAAARGEFGGQAEHAANNPGGGLY